MLFQLIVISYDLILKKFENQLFYFWEYEIYLYEIYISQNFSYCIIYVTACDIDIGMVPGDLKVNRVLFPKWITRIRIFSNIFPMIKYNNI